MDSGWSWGGVTLQCVGKSGGRGGGSRRAYSKYRFQDSSENEKSSCIFFLSFVFCDLEGLLFGKVFESLSELKVLLPTRLPLATVISTPELPRTVDCAVL